MPDRVTLTDLEVITRFSLAVRAASADRDEVIAALRADLAWLEGPAKPAPTVAKATPKRAAPARKAATPTAKPAR